ncbi:MAG TPA: hypothetical protein VK862_12955 [Afifellaceae bacterium]|nr:hypothetical protein [Afifellaceae bacterium]
MGEKMNPTPSGTTSLIDELTKRLFPAKATVLARAELLTNANRNQAVAYIEECKAFEEELRFLSESALIALFEDEMELDRQLQSEKAQSEEKNRFFHDRSARADYGHWIGRETWTVDEAPALLLGKSPEVVNWPSINPLVYKSPFARRYEMLRKDMRAAREAGQIRPADSPAGFIRYAKAAGFVLPADLQSLLAARPAEPELAEPEADESRDAGVSTFRQLIEQNRKGGQAAPDAAAPDAAQAEAKASVAERTIAAMRQEREVLLKMLGALALGRYGFDPASDDTAVTRAIVADLRKGGFPVNVASTHKLVGEAARWVAKQGGGR